MLILHTLLVSGDRILKPREAHVTRTVLTVAALLFGASTLLGSTAQACVSCEYVPEVVNTPTKKSLHAKRKHKKSPPVARQTAPTRKHVGKSGSIARTAPAKVETAPAKSDVAKTDAETEGTQRLTGSSALIQSSLPSPQPVTAAAESEEGACKKFFPAVGKTLSVPCE